MSVVFGCVLVVFGCVSTFLICDGVCCHCCLRCVDASVLASMRWLLRGGDGSSEETTSVITENIPQESFFFSLKFYSNSKSAPRQICNYFFGDGIFSHFVKSVMCQAQQGPVPDYPGSVPGRGFRETVDKVIGNLV